MASSIDLNYNELPIMLNKNDRRVSAVLLLYDLYLLRASSPAFSPNISQFTITFEKFPAKAFVKFIIGASKLYHEKSLMLFLK